MNCGISEQCQTQGCVRLINRDEIFYKIVSDNKMYHVWNMYVSRVYAL